MKDRLDIITSVYEKTSEGVLRWSSRSAGKGRFFVSNEIEDIYLELWPSEIKISFVNKDKRFNVEFGGYNQNLKIRYEELVSLVNDAVKPNSNIVDDFLESLDIGYF